MRKNLAFIYIHIYSHPLLPHHHQQQHQNPASILFTPPSLPQRTPDSPNSTHPSHPTHPTHPIQSGFSSPWTLPLASSNPSSPSSEIARLPRPRVQPQRQEPAPSTSIRTWKPIPRVSPHARAMTDASARARMWPACVSRLRAMMCVTACCQRLVPCLL